ncbi:MAG: hypothetical protein WD851_17130 [Pirellulales bacterium]
MHRTIISTASRLVIRRRRVWGWYLAVVLQWLETVGALSSAWAAEYVVNTDDLTIRRNGALWNFDGQLVSPSVVGGAAQFSIGGDWVLNSGDTLSGVGSRPASFQIGNDFIVSPNATIDFSAVNTTAGIGGAAPGSGGSGGAGGAGGAGGGVQWVRGGGAMIFFIPGAVPPPVPAFAGHDGQWGDEGTLGLAGAAGKIGRIGFHNLAPAAAGGSGGFEEQVIGHGGVPGQGGIPGVYWPSPLPSFIPGVPTKNGGFGFEGNNGGEPGPPRWETSGMAAAFSPTQTPSAWWRVTAAVAAAAHKAAPAAVAAAAVVGPADKVTGPNPLGLSGSVLPASGARADPAAPAASADRAAMAARAAPVAARRNLSSKVRSTSMARPQPKAAMELPGRSVPSVRCPITTSRWTKRPTSRRTSPSPE